MLPGLVDPQHAPVVSCLLTGGLPALLERARLLSVEPLGRYSAACDLCTHIRRHLFDVQPSADLGPEGFYDSRSLPDHVGG